MWVSSGRAVALAVLVTVAPGVRAADTGPLPVSVETGVKVPMRDGVTLIADVYRPPAEGHCPVLLQRPPYGRRDPQTGLKLASHGYVVVLQDTRGRFDSGGEFYPFRSEAADGYDTVQWAAAGPDADGHGGACG